MDRPPASRLPAEERERASAIRLPGRRRRWIAARWALRKILARYLGRDDPAGVALEIGPNGKPALVGSPPPLRFNLSHSGDVVLVAVCADREVGVDVEAIESHRPQAFYEAWTRKEAVSKCFGGGLAAPLPAAPMTVIALETGPGYAAALAVDGRGPASVRRYFLEEPASVSSSADFTSR